jgi:AcrR family transcriptional regulator
LAAASCADSATSRSTGRGLGTGRVRRPTRARPLGGRRESGRAVKTKKKRAYDASGRRAEAERTRERIVEAASKLLHRVRPENLSYADVAEHCGVAVRTVYRHFPETIDLLRAVAQGTIQRFAAEGLSESRPEVALQLANLHRLLSAEPTLFRVFMAAPIRGELELERIVPKLFGDVLEELPSEHQSATTALMELLLSPFAWEVLHTLWKVPPERITRACLAAAQFIADGARRHPDWLAPSTAAPPLFRSRNSNTGKDRS